MKLDKALDKGAVILVSDVGIVVALFIEVVVDIDVIAVDGVVVIMAFDIDIVVALDTALLAELDCFSSIALELETQNKKMKDIWSVVER